MRSGEVVIAPPTLMTAKFLFVVDCERVSVTHQLRGQDQQRTHASNAQFPALS